MSDLRRWPQQQFVVACMVWNFPQQKGPWLQFPHHCTCRPFQLRNFRPNSWTQELLLLPFLLITFLAMEYVHRLHEVMMSDQIESTGTYPLPHRKLFCNYLKLSAQAAEVSLSIRREPCLGPVCVCMSGFREFLGFPKQRIQHCGTTARDMLWVRASHQHSQECLTVAVCSNAGCCDKVGKSQGQVEIFPFQKSHSEPKLSKICWLPNQKGTDLTSKHLGSRGGSQQMLLWYLASNLTPGN